MLQPNELFEHDCASVTNVSMLQVRGLIGRRKLQAKVPCACQSVPGTSFLAKWDDVLHHESVGV